MNQLSPEITNLLFSLVGAVIGFASSLAITIVNNRHQEKRDLQNREWAQEDKKGERTRAAFISRAKYAEQFVDFMFSAIQAHITGLREVVNQGDIKVAQMNILQAVDELKDADRMHVYILCVDDPMLNAMADQYKKLLKDVVSLGQLIVKKMENRVLDYIESANKLKEAQSSNIQLKVEMIKRLDELSVFD